MLLTQVWIVSGSLWRTRVDECGSPLRIHFVRQRAGDSRTFRACFRALRAALSAEQRRTGIQRSWKAHEGCGRGVLTDRWRQNGFRYRLAIRYGNECGKLQH
jgi:hypothetical protein